MDPNRDRLTDHTIFFHTPEEDALSQTTTVPQASLAESIPEEALISDPTIDATKKKPFRKKKDAPAPVADTAPVEEPSAEPVSTALLPVEQNPSEPPAEVGTPEDALPAEAPQKEKGKFLKSFEKATEKEQTPKDKKFRFLVIFSKKKAKESQPPHEVEEPGESAQPTSISQPTKEKKPKEPKAPKAPKEPTPPVATAPSATPAEAPKRVRPTVVQPPVRKGTSPWSVVWTISAFIWKLALGLVLVIGIAIVGMVGYLSVTEYHPAYAEAADRGSVNRNDAIASRSLRILTFNTGYAGLGADVDSFLAGGEGVLPEDQETVEYNMDGIEALLKSRTVDFILLQEVDVDSQRSYGLNQWLTYEHILEDFESRFAMNYSCDYVPYPLTKPLGKVESGLATYSAYDIVSATRYSMEDPHNWPARIVNMKRCLLVTRIPISGSDNELVLVNVHMEDYEDAEDRNAQMAQLLDLVKQEYAKGNYVIAGGDFHQTFPGSNAYAVKDEDYWTPEKLKTAPYGWHYAYDDSRPTCRLLNQPYDASDANTQYYVVDGFLVSPNVTIDNVSTLNCHFRYSDHNPVLLDFTLSMDMAE
ncbi:MAG: hypothetical protein IKT58_05065 [Oscillospiraceae bacterium]|nr:hypothetical protein [Oscillospiraceae bacterium]